MTDAKTDPDFETMTLFELLKFESENMGDNREWDTFFSALEETYPFDGIFSRFETIENEVHELQAQFARLVNALDKQLDPVDVSLKEWIKR